MKVLNPGKYAVWTLERVCTGDGNGEGGCGAKLLIEEGDLYHTYSSHYDGSSETYITFRCCNCKCPTDVPQRLVPPHIKIRDQERGTGG